MKKLILIFILSLISCKTDKKRLTKIDLKPKVVEQKDTITLKYVTAKSGLVFRKKPRGKKLGKIPYETEVSVLKHTGDFQEIKTSEGILKGEWVEIKYDNKKGYVFDGYLTDNTTNNLNMDFEEAQKLLKNGVWVATEFKNILTRTNLYSDAGYYRYSPHNIIFYDDVKVAFWSENQMEVKKYKLDKKFRINSVRDYKIVALSDDSMTLSYHNMKFEYFKIDQVFDKDSDLFDQISKGTEITLKKWFSGDYIFKKDEDEIEITFDENSDIQFHAWYKDYKANILVDVIKINNDLYLINKFENNTYYLDKIKLFEDFNEPEAIPIGEKATLKRL